MTPAMFNIGLALAAGPAHGYALIADVEAITQGSMRLGPGTLYRSLQRMTAEGLLEERADLDGSGDPRRRHYALTRSGHAAVSTHAQMLAGLVDAAITRGVLPTTSKRRREIADV